MAGDEKPMKSAYELAMERFAQSESAGPPLTEEQKLEIAAIDREMQAKIAEQEILSKSRIQAALTAGNAEDAARLRDEMAIEVRRIRERAESKKDEVRRQKG